MRQIGRYHVGKSSFLWSSFTWDTYVFQSSCDLQLFMSSLPWNIGTCSLDELAAAWPAKWKKVPFLFSVSYLPWKLYKRSWPSRQTALGQVEQIVHSSNPVFCLSGVNNVTQNYSDGHTTVLTDRQQKLVQTQQLFRTPLSPWTHPERF